MNLIDLQTSQQKISHFRLGEWLIKPSERLFKRGDEQNVVEPRAMQVLLYLVNNHNELISAEELLQCCWAGTFYGDNPVHKAIAQLRKAFDDKATKPEYIETIRKKGYRLIAPLTFPGGVEVDREIKTWSQGSPYLGLESFTPKHASIYFGRDVALRNLLQTIVTRVKGQKPFVLILGPSGSGKSSLINAGIIPRLSSQFGYHDLYCHSNSKLDLRNQRQSLMEALADNLATFEIHEGAEKRLVYHPDEQQQLADWLRSQEYDKAFAPIYRAIKQYRFKHPDPTKIDGFCLILDQFEQICANPDYTKEQVMAFMSAIDALVDTGLVLVLVASRNDFYHDIIKLPQLTSLKRHDGGFDILPPTPGEVSEMIRKPALAAGLSFEQDPRTQIRLDDQIRDDAIARPDILPLLQYTLNELYHQRNAKNEMTFQAYYAIGGIEGALSKKVEEVVENLDKPAQNSLDALLGKLLIQTKDRALAARPTEWSQITNPDELRLVQALVDSRLLTSELVNEQRIISVSHESLFMHWPRAMEWVDSHREMLRAYAEVHEAAERWQAQEYRRDYLLGEGKPLIDAKTLIEENQIQLEPVDREFINASITRSAQRKVVWRMVSAGLLVLAITTSLASMLAFQSERDAQQQQAQAEELVNYMLGDLSERLQPLGHLSIMNSVSDAAMNYLESNRDDTANTDAALLRVRALLQIGSIRLNQSDTEGALQAFTEGADLAERLLVRNPNNTDYLLQAGNAQYWLGSVHRGRHQFELVEKHYNRYMDYAKQWTSIAPDNPIALVELSYAYNNLGTLKSDQSDWPGSIEYFQKSVDLKKQALNIEPGSTRLEIELAESISWLASASAKSGNILKAKDYFSQAEKMLEAILVDDESNNLAKFRYARIKNHISEIEEKLANFDSGLEFASKSNSIFQELVEIAPENSLYQSQLANSFSWMAKNQKGIGDLNSALESVEKAVTISYGLTELDPESSDLKVRYMLNLLNQAEINAALGNDVVVMDILNQIFPSLSDAEFNYLQQDVLVRAKLLIGNLWCSMGDKKGYIMLEAVEEISNDSLEKHFYLDSLISWLKARYWQGESLLNRLTELEETGYNMPWFTQQLMEYEICYK